MPIDSPPVSICFIHGLGDDKARFAQYAKQFDQEGMECHLIELPDYSSLNPQPELDRSLSKMVQRAFAKVSPCSKKMIVAHSLGGLLAVADESISQIADRLVLVEPSIRMADFSFFEMLLAPARGVRIQNFTEKLSESDADIPTDYLDKLASWSEAGFEAYCRLAIGRIPTVRQCLKTARGPVTIAYGCKSWGSQDKLDHSSLKNVELQAFEASGHWPFVNERMAFSSFLNDIMRTI